MSLQAPKPYSLKAAAAKSPKNTSVLKPTEHTEPAEKCPICLDLFDRILELPCGHSCCNDCLQATVEDNEKCRLCEHLARRGVTSCRTEAPKSSTSTSAGQENEREKKSKPSRQPCGKQEVKKAVSSLSDTLCRWERKRKDEEESRKPVELDVDDERMTVIPRSMASRSMTKSFNNLDKENLQPQTPEGAGNIVPPTQTKLAAERPESPKMCSWSCDKNKPAPHTDEDAPPRNSKRRRKALIGRGHAVSIDKADLQGVSTSAASFGTPPAPRPVSFGSIEAEPPSCPADLGEAVGSSSSLQFHVLRGNQEDDQAVHFLEAVISLYNVQIPYMGADLVNATVRAKEYLTVVAVKTGHVVGGATFRERGDLSFTELFLMAVAQQDRCKGIGGMLMTQLKAHSLNAKIPILITYADAHAVRFFRKQRFHREEFLGREKWEGLVKYASDAFLMQCCLVELHELASYNITYMRRKRHKISLSQQSQHTDEEELPDTNDDHGQTAASQSTNASSLPRLADPNTIVCELCGLPDQQDVASGHEGDVKPVSLGDFMGPYSVIEKGRCDRATDGAAAGEKAKKDRGFWVHEYCALWSPEVYTDQNEFRMLAEAIRRSRGIRCAWCGKNGATIGCKLGACRRSYHYPCLHHVPCTMFADVHLILCPVHSTHDESRGVKSRPESRAKFRKGPVVPTKSLAVRTLFYENGVAGANSKETRQKPPMARKVVLLGSRLSDDQKSEMAEIARTLRCQVAQDFSSCVTHIVTPADGQAAGFGRIAKRTVKYLLGVVNGCWIVSYDWLTACRDAGRLVDELSYEIEGDMHGIGAPAKARARQPDEPRLFEGMWFAFHGAADAKLGQADLINIIRAGGGEICSQHSTARASTGSMGANQARLPPLPAGANVYILSNGSCGGPSAVERVALSLDIKVLGGGSPGELHFVTPSWLLDCVSQFKVLEP